MKPILILLIPLFASCTLLPHGSSLTVGASFSKDGPDAKAVLRIPLASHGQAMPGACAGSRLTRL